MIYNQYTELERIELAIKAIAELPDNEKIGEVKGALRSCAAKIAEYRSKHELESDPYYQAFMRECDRITGTEYTDTEKMLLGEGA